MSSYLIAENGRWKRKLMIISIREALLAGKSVCLVSPDKEHARRQLKDLLEDDLIRQIDFNELSREQGSRARGGQ